MRSIVASAAHGHGHSIVVRGEAGIGKTRLTEEFEALALAAGLQVSRGQALNDPGMPVLWPWRRPLADIPGGLSLIDDAHPVEVTNAADASNARFRFLSQVSDLIIRSTTAPGRMLILEDLHWADELSCALLRQLVLALRSAPLVLVLTQRVPQIPSSGHADDTIAELVGRSGTDVIRLGGLHSRQVEQWFARLQGISPKVGQQVAAAITDSDGANPLHVRLVGEALQRNPSADPADLDLQDLRRLVGQQLATLPVEVRHTLRAAAMINDRILPGLLARIAERDRSAVEADIDLAVQAGILRQAPGDEAYTFVHVLVRDAVRADLCSAERREYHFRAATAIAETPHAERFAGLIARHWLLSGRPDADQQALTWLRRAATGAGVRQDLDTALDAWGQALAAAERLGLYEVCGWLHIDRARARFCAGKINESLADSAAAVELAHQVGDPEMAARAALVVAGVGGVEPSAMIERLCDDALALMPDPPTDPNHRHLTSRMLSRRAQTLVFRDLPRARELSRTALGMVDDGCADAVLDAVAARHLALSTPGRLSDRVTLAQRAIGVGTTAHQPLGPAWGHIWMFEAAMQRGDLDRADREIHALQRIVAADEWPMARWHLLRERACRAALIGELDAAERAAAEAGALATDLADHSIQHLHQGFRAELGFIRETLPDDLVSESLTTFTQAAGTDPIPSLMVVRLLLHSGSVDAARIAYQPWREMIIDGSRRPADAPAWQTPLLWHGEIAVGLGDTEASEAAYQEMITDPGPYRGDGSGLIISTGALARHTADLALATGRVREAISLHRLGISQNLKIGAVPFVALGRLGLAEALLAAASEAPSGSGQTIAGLDEAGVLLGSAITVFDRLQMSGALARARRLRLSLLARPVTQLTPRETEIARLVAEAQSNREIARRLVVSERTVESHVRNALAKVGAETRTGLAAWVLRQNR
ncbi:AAA ATPase domain-containing protein [Microlunatus soli]|uniref:AAA ATPase domain-containing protein n=2 Tax=Microlunatus soli TaxID=630515 RepID=A0A1H1TQF2_9ACTN|nr:AAA ATPase domain-containing protein [Microlunatus soli]